MSLSYKNLSVIAYANGFTLWHYTDKNKNYKDFDVNNTFTQIKSMCNKGDKIMITLKDCYMEAIIINFEEDKVICKEIIKVSY